MSYGPKDQEVNAVTIISENEKVKEKKMERSSEFR